MAAQILKFVSRHEQLQLRGTRNYGRWMMKTKGYVADDSPEAARWRAEVVREAMADADWARRHGPVEGGAWVASFPHTPEPPRRKCRRLAERR